MITIYTDGSGYRTIVDSTPYVSGGWACLVFDDFGVPTFLSGKRSGVTNNEMEIRAIIEGLSITPVGSDVTIYTDYQSVIDVFLTGTYKYWKAKQWRNRQGRKLNNASLWKGVVKLYEERYVTFKRLTKGDEVQAHNVCHGISNMQAYKGLLIQQGGNYIV